MRLSVNPFQPFPFSSTFLVQINILSSDPIWSFDNFEFPANFSLSLSLMYLLDVSLFEKFGNFFEAFFLFLYLVTVWETRGSEIYIFLSFANVERKIDFQIVGRSVAEEIVDSRVYILRAM